MTHTGPHTGQCLCGAVKLSLKGDPIAARMCWCHDCQRLASGSATVNALFAPENVTVTGPVTLHHKTADSGNTVERAFCSACGSHVFSRPLLDPPVAYRIRAGALDNPEIAKPTGIIWTASAPSWAVMDPALPQFPKAPPA
ncbi:MULTISPECIES: GFA family protein [unclassified Novosphingobium]|uniref:GFA family protein n=1 Tax=unclassified Novosphingobium TaxID=2644732 RepID=UPI000868FBDC|nr:MULTISPECIES: GFA family protein [unclassified Novosphingobium]MBN9143502.1 GFA family protein [Novosphingobium sp.]MDR6706752.1 hypothetical protein [Novosphingobium sp. 1748]ODU83728.1 MAG: hypothetical protein ABT10_05600 [Novosphingobium sp. SCN 63-17]OJX92691.1 MAG: hypothetical protein BGP00_22320 [Novosphingobium sp. 63-713]